MISTLKYIAPKIKNLTVGGFVSGFLVGCFPNKLFINFDGKEYKSFEIPLISGVIGSTGIILSPLLLINYFCNGTYFDRLVDKYDINMERYHQYDDKKNRYAYPSLLIVNIKSKDYNF